MGGRFLAVAYLVIAAACAQGTPTRPDGIAPAAGSLSPAATAVKPPDIPAWYNGQIVHFTVVSDNVVGTPENRPAIPLYSFGEPGNQPQFDVLSAIPGVNGYNPWWEVFAVVVLDGRDVTTNPFTSESELLAAAAAGDVLIIDTDFIFLCQVLPGANR